MRRRLCYLENRSLILTINRSRVSQFSEICIESSRKSKSEESSSNRCYLTPLLFLQLRLRITHLLRILFLMSLILTEAWRLPINKRLAWTQMEEVKMRKARLRKLVVLKSSRNEEEKQ